MNQFTFITGDCLQEQNYPKEKADLILFDPPFWPAKQQYQQIREDSRHKLEKIPTPSPEQYADWWDAVCAMGQQYLKSTGWFCHKSDSWMGFLSFPTTTKYFEYSNEVLNGDLLFNPEIIWDKGRIGIGKKIRTQHEKILCYTAQSNDQKYWKYPECSSLKRKQVNLEGEVATYKMKKWHGGSKGIAFSSILHIPNFNNGTLGIKTTDHINQTPEVVWDQFIDYMCPKDGLILDLTMGLGSIAKAVKRVNTQKKGNRRYWGIEIVPKYVNFVKQEFSVQKLDAIMKVNVCQD